MEKNNKMMLGAALVVALVALAGAGYAATTAYQGETTNSGNSLDSTYITVTQGESAAYAAHSFLKNAYFNSVNETDVFTTTYTPVYTHKVTTTTNPATIEVASETVEGNMASISNPLTITITPTNSKDTSLEVEVKVSNFNPISTVDYMMVLTDNTNKVVAFDSYGTTGSVNKADMWGFNITLTADAQGNAQAATYNVLLFISGSINAVEGTPMDSHVGFNVTGTDSSTDSKFTFTAISPKTS